MSPERPLVGTVTRAVQRADTVPALRSGVCDAVVDAVPPDGSDPERGARFEVTGCRGE